MIQMSVLFPVSKDKYLERAASVRPKLRLCRLATNAMFLALMVLSYLGFKMVVSHSAWLAALFVIFFALSYVGRAGKKIRTTSGIACPNCGHTHESTMALNALLSSGNCFGCGYKMLENEDGREVPS